MNNKVINTISFLAGAAIGAFATWKIIKTKYERIAQEEIDSVKEEFSKKKVALDNEVQKAHIFSKEVNGEEAQKIEYNKIIEETNYNHSEENEPVKKKTVDEHPHIYVIPPESAGENDYEISSLTYYADDVLVDETDEIVDDINYLVGKDSLTHFGEYEDDSVWVRNEELQTDFEILRDLRTYSEATTRTTRPVEDD